MCVCVCADRDLGCDLYVDHYCRDHPQLCVWAAQHPATLSQGELYVVDRGALYTKATSWDPLVNRREDEIRFFCEVC